MAGASALGSRQLIGTGRTTSALLLVRRLSQVFETLSTRLCRSCRADTLMAMRRQ